MGMVVSSLSIVNKFDDVIEQVRGGPLADDSYEQLSEMIYERLVALETPIMTSTTCCNR
jgi:hypothetical protein